MAKPNPRVCVVTGGRADYGPLLPVLQRLKASRRIDLQIVAAGMHLSETYGMTVKAIIEDGFTIDARAPSLATDSGSTAMARSIGDGVSAAAAAYDRLQPDAVLVLGDRFEIFAAAAAAMAMTIPIIHLCGGDVTEGAVDDAIRNAITKMAHLHFPTNSQSAARIRQMGEQPERVMVTGSPGIDLIKTFRPMEKAALEKDLDFRFRDQNLLITFHPVTLDETDGADQAGALLTALDHRSEGMIFTMPNADTGGDKIFDLICDFVRTHDNTCFHKSLGQQRYLSVLGKVDAVVGNSSSALSEAPSLRTVSVNIGDRQSGRLRGPSVIDCPAVAAEIGAAVDRALSQEIDDFTNPYGDGDAAARIVSALEAVPDFRALLHKPFYGADSAS